MDETEIEKAQKFEKSNDLQAAVKMYEVLLKRQPTGEGILTRLIINCRKLKDYKKELKYINALIILRESFYTPQNKKGALIISISEKINKSIGATDKKGKRLYSDASIDKLEKRKELVIGKINQSTK